MTTRLGPKQRALILALDDDGKWTPPSVYMCALEARGCPSGVKQIDQLAARGLLEMRWHVQSHAEILAEFGPRPPGRATAEINAAIRLTGIGRDVRNQLAAES